MIAALAQHDLAFYSTAAQVLPLLVIVAVVELRYLPAETDDLPKPWRIYGTMGYCGLATVAEFKLLLALATDNGSPVVSVLAMFCLTLGVGVVFAAPVVGIQHALNRQKAKRQQDERNRIEPPT